MTIFNHNMRSTRGQAMIFALALSVFILAIVYGALLTNRSATQVSSKSSQMTMQLFSAHGIASLLKQELNSNYTNFSAGTNGWGVCNGGGTTAFNYISVLNNPSAVSAACAAVKFTFAYFQTTGSNPTSAVALSSLLSTSLTPLSTITPSPTNAQQITVSLTEFNTNPSRNLLLGSITIQPPANGTSLFNTQNLKLAINVARTIASPSGNPSCHICRAVPGSVCCGGSRPTNTFAFLAGGSGVIMDAIYDPSSHTFSLSADGASADPLAVSVKNLASLPTYYHSKNFCITAIQPTGLMYVIDAATQNGHNFYLTSSGVVLYEDGTTIVTDPKIRSIAYDSAASLWYILRSDGQVMSTTKLSDVTTYTSIQGLILPTAKVLTIGSGPPLC